MNIDEIRLEVFKQTGKSIDHDDPFFIALAMLSATATSIEIKNDAALAEMRLVRDEIARKAVEKHVEVITHSMQSTSGEIYTSVRKAVEREFSGYKLALMYGATGVEAFNLAISKMNVKISDRTLEGCRLVILGGMSTEDAALQVQILPNQLSRAVKQIKTLIPTDYNNHEKPTFKPLNTKVNNPTESLIKYAQYFGFFLLGSILMYFLKY
ncbi:hypothetical protein Meth11DRAFT_1384 [Methylophilaceae bacterium 11]|nr:hypothetical protein Meth11DRAFT_1384 [Methylophilaceae bacterium 11]